MRRVIVLCLAAILAAGCGDDKKPTEPATGPAFPNQPPAPPPTPGKKDQPGMSRLPGPADSVPGSNS